MTLLSRWDDDDRAYQAWLDLGEPEHPIDWDFEPYTGPLSSPATKGEPCPTALTASR